MRSNRIIPHAVSAAGANNYGYDCTGNMTSRNIGGQNYTLTYDAENHLTAVNGPNVTVSFAYDGDGNRVQADWVGSPDHTIIAYIGNIYEYQKVGTTNTTVRQYYYAGSTRIAMRQGGTLSWLFGDHLGSTSAVANFDGSAGPTQLYKPWGEKRPPGASSLPTTFRYTGQRQESSLGGTDGLYFYGARWLNPALGRFVQADFLIPGMDNPQRWDRFGYVLNNPLRYTDPSGHSPAGPCSPGDDCDTDQGSGQGNNTDSDTGADDGGCGGQGCDLGGNNDDNNTENDNNNSDGGSMEDQMPDGNPTAPQDLNRNIKPLKCTTGAQGQSGCRPLALIIGAGLVVFGGLVFIGGFMALAGSISALNIELSGAFALITAAGGGLAIVGGYMIYKSRCLPEFFY